MLATPLLRENLLPGRFPTTRDHLLFWFTPAIVLISRLPFLGAGYGNDPDAWEMVNAARTIRATGHYTASRLPGYPLPEYAYAVLQSGGPLLVNGCTALLGLFGVACFVKSMKHLRCPSPHLAGLALAMTPVVFVNSINAMDYIWALTFILASCHLALIRRSPAAGFVLGAAAACRLTSLLMLVPLSFLLLWRGARGRRRDLATFVVPALLTTVVAYAPVLVTYGLHAAAYSRPGAYPPLVEVFSRATLRIWGPLGLLGLAAGAVPALVGGKDRRRGVSLADEEKATLVAAALAVTLYVGLFLFLPLEEGYLIPAVPFVILLLGRLWRPAAFRLICILLCLSPFLAGLNRSEAVPAKTMSRWACEFHVGGQRFTLDCLRGPILRDHAERRHGMAFVDRILQRAAGLPPGSVVLVGYWLPQIRARLGAARPEGLPSEWTGATDVRFAYLLSREELAGFAAAGTPVYYLPEMAEFNEEACGADPARGGAMSLDEYWSR